MSRVKNCFTNLQKANKKALISYITAGDPHPNSTVEIMHALVEAGTDIIEIGVPFSDPMADGPVIQAACERALMHETSLSDVLRIVGEFRQKNDFTPLILMGYQNPVEVFGLTAFAQQARGLVDGMITVDLPPEESAKAAKIYQNHDIDTIYLIAPTTPEARVKFIADMASGFLYYVSFKGITGGSQLDIKSVEQKIAQIRGQTQLPLAVGFGIKDAQTASLVAGCADAVVVGSAIVSLIEKHADNLTLAKQKITELLSSIRVALDNVEVNQKIA